MAIWRDSSGEERQEWWSVLEKEERLDLWDQSCVNMSLNGAIWTKLVLDQSQISTGSIPNRYQISTKSANQNQISTAPPSAEGARRGNQATYGGELVASGGSLPGAGRAVLIAPSDIIMNE